MAHSGKSRVSANLSYLTIYNPTLRSSAPISDDEDAEEQAQILFYTSKERAVSRDRMLRQVGLAKALANFSEMFSAEQGCENIHSQTRRMVMVSPEPDFYIHAGVELAKTPRLSATTVKAKGKDKSVKSILKGKEKEREPPVTTYDYSDASVHDLALRADILKEYERFKLTHGSFTSILSTLGQQALELQLERFFTIWAWSWNLEGGHEFGGHLGTPLHPKHQTILPLLDTLSTDIPDAIIPIAVTSTHAIPSTRYSQAQLPASLSAHLLALMPPPESPSPSTSSSTLPAVPDGTVRPKRPPDHTADPSDNDTKANPSGDTSQSTFMGMGMPSMDVSKWGWLTFGKNGKKPAGLDGVTRADGKEKTDEDKSGAEEEGKQASESTSSTEEDPPTRTTDTAEVDQSALDDAISSEGVTPLSPPEQKDKVLVEPEPEKAEFTTAELDRVSIVSGVDIESDADNTAHEETESLPTAQSASRPSPPPPPPRDFSITMIHLADDANPLNTRRRKVHYLTRRPFLIALIGLDACLNDADESLSQVSIKVESLLDAIDTSLEDDALKNSAETIPSANKILQPNDQHIFALEHGRFTVPSTLEKSSPHSTHLYNAQALLESEHDIQEVFSRGQSPQHWHIARQLGEDSLNGEVFMEVFRKETSLTDVDNVLTGVVRRMEDIMQ